MTKIANKEYCNSLESSNSGIFLTNLIEECPTYEEIIGTDKFNINGTYQDNQLVKESDISLYAGNIKNYSFVWGEYDTTLKNQQPSNSVNVKIKQNFLYAPTIDLSIKINFTIGYKNNPLVTRISTTSFTQNITFTQSTNTNKIFAYTKNFNFTFGIINSVFNYIKINSVTVEPLNQNTNIDFNYITNIKNITENYFVNIFSIEKTDFTIDYYEDNVNENIITNTCTITPIFNIPTGNSINDILIYDSLEHNYSSGSSVGNGPIYDTTNNKLSYTFNAIDNYGKRGYKLPYFYTKFIVKQSTTDYESYVYAIWNPNSTKTGIELTNIITEE